MHPTIQTPAIKAALDNREIDETIRHALKAIIDHFEVINSRFSTINDPERRYSALATAVDNERRSLQQHRGYQTQQMKQVLDALNRFEQLYPPANFTEKS